MFDTSHLVEGFPEDEPDGACHSPPSADCGVQLLSALAGEPIELGLAVVVADAPLGGDASAILEAMERGIEGALLNLEGAFRGPFDGLRDGMSMGRSHEQGAQDEQIEGALENFSGFRRPFHDHELSPLECLWQRHPTPLECLWEANCLMECFEFAA